MLHTFSTKNFKPICDALAAKDADIKLIVDTYGYPPMWTRTNTFESLVHIVLEQQVSLASALAALNKLREKIIEITPLNFLQLSDAELKACYFSRQKTGYVKALAVAINSGNLNLKSLEKLPDNEVRKQLIALKGVGNWTIDVYLMFVLRRADIFPVGDLAAVNALKQIKQLPKQTHKEVLLKIANNWHPYRTVATMILWHYYLSIRTNKKSPGIEEIKAASYDLPG